MAIAFDAASSLAGTATGDFNWTHTPSGTPRGVLVLIIQNVGITDEVVGVTYGGTAMTEVPLSPFLWSASVADDGALYGYWLGSSVPTGAQSVAVDVDATGSVKKAAAITVTAANDTIIEDTSIDSTTNGGNPSVTMTVTRETICLAGIHSGNATLSAISPGSGFTEITEVDFGSQVAGWERSTSTHSASNYTCGYTSTTGTAQALFAIAMAESGALIEQVGQANETDLAQPIAWAPKHRSVAQALETDTAQGIQPAAPDVVLQVQETDLAQTIAEVKSRTLGQPTETDLAQVITALKSEAVGQAIETDTAGTISFVFPLITGQATETDLAQVVTPFSSLTQAQELDRARQVTVLGGLSVVSDAPVLIRAPRKAGRIFHEFMAPSGEGYHPNVAEWQSEEDAPGGFRAASGLISSRVFHAHREVFRSGGMWRTFLEDGTCIFAGTLREPDPQDSIIQLNARGRAHIVDREVGPILYQTHVGSEISYLAGQSDEWRVEFTTMSHNDVDTGIVFTRSKDQDPGSANVIIPLFGRNPAFLRCHMQGQQGFLSIKTGIKVTAPRSDRSSELDIGGVVHENFYFNFGVGITAENIEVDLTIGAELLPSPNNSVFTNVGTPEDAGIGYLWPDVIMFGVTDWGSTSATFDDEAILLSNIEINGAPLGSAKRYTVGDLVEDIAARLGFPEVRESGSYDITPYELPPGAPASEALDWACVISGKRYRILDTGAGATFEWDHWNANQWALASPWSPLRTIPEDRFDAVAVPFQYPGTQGQLTDQVIVRADPSPLPRRRIAWDVEWPHPMHNREAATNLGAQLADELTAPRFTGDFAAAELVGPDGEKVSAHHANAGDVLQPWRRSEPGRLRIGRLVRFDDHVEGEFDGENRALDKFLARRDKRRANRGL